jgi:hypothetical protein
VQSNAITSSPLESQKLVRCSHSTRFGFPQYDLPLDSISGMFSSMFRNTAKSSTQSRAALDAQATTTPSLRRSLSLFCWARVAFSSPIVLLNTRTQASVAHGILKLKFSDSIAVHRRILVTIWRNFCKWNSSVAVTALQKARLQAHLGAATDDPQLEADSSPAAPSISTNVLPLDGSPQVTALILSVLLQYHFRAFTSSHQCAWLFGRVMTVR